MVFVVTAGLILAALLGTGGLIWMLRQPGLDEISSGLLGEIMAPVTQSITQLFILLAYLAPLLIAVVPVYFVLSSKANLKDRSGYMVFGAIFGLGLYGVAYLTGLDQLLIQEIRGSWFVGSTVKIKALDKGTPANNHEYTLATEKALSGASPISDDGSTAPSISAHLTSIGGSTTDEVVQYQIYCQVTALGTVSGETLTATISYTPFGTLHYVKSSESSTADVVPSINVTSWLDEALGLPGETIMTALAAMTVAATVILIRRGRA